MKLNQIQKPDDIRGLSLTEVAELAEEVRETIIVHDEVQANPAAYRELERIVTDRFDYQPPRVFIERTVPPAQITPAN